jgi:hypothetical protein
MKLYAHLAKHDKSIDPARLFLDPYKLMYTNEPNNDYPEIFITGWAQTLFLNAEELIISNSSTRGDYNYIFQMLNHQSVNAIHENVSLKKFIEFINETRNIELNLKSNKPSTSAIKENAMKYLLRRYFNQMQALSGNKLEKAVQNVIKRKAT